jgi:hypothetical protein
MGDNDGVMISFAEMYGEVRQTHDEVKEMRAELRAITDHETRIRSLERKILLACGCAAGLSAGLAEVIRLIAGG